MLTDVYSRASYLRDVYRSRYRSAFEQSEWDEDELEELGPTLRASVECGIAERAFVRARVKHLEYVVR